MSDTPHAADAPRTADAGDVVDITVSTHDQARAAFRSRALRQALYDEGDVVMADVLVNLHGAEHRARRRLENRLFTAATHRATSASCSRRSSTRPSRPTSRQDVPSW